MKTVVWTDGSCDANGMHGRGGWAARIEQAGSVHEISGSAQGTTHNRMELTAICEALETLTEGIEVHTDSTYVEKCFNQTGTSGGCAMAPGRDPTARSRTETSGSGCSVWYGTEGET